MELAGCTEPKQEESPLEERRLGLNLLSNLLSQMLGMELKNTKPEKF